MSSAEELAASVMERIDALAGISETPGRLTRRCLTPEHRRVNDLVAVWMNEAGMSVREDTLGNVIGRYEGAKAGDPALIIGSHLDTVVDAGKYDGMLGVLAGIACVQRLHIEGRRFPFAIEVLGFADEEGVRFGTTYLGSRGLAGTFDAAYLERRDDDGHTLAQALEAFGLDAEKISEARRGPGDILAYLELHIEQGPVLESECCPVGAVSSISGQSRLRIHIEGAPGHAGTVPMSLRRDAMAAAAETVLAVESLCRDADGVVGTVGTLNVEPGAINVIPGRVTFTVDVRAAEDAARQGAVARITRAAEAAAGAREASVEVTTIHEAPSIDCAEPIAEAIERAIGACGFPPRRLPSGAGHDAAAMAAITDVGMIFVRCKDGISHSPKESVAAADVAVAIDVLSGVVADLAERTQQ